MISPARQLDLDFAPRFRAQTGDDRVGELLDFLHERGWVSGREICASKQWTERLVRLLAAASVGQVLSGQRGYKLTREASPDELHHATAWLESQAKQMSERAGQIRRVWHGSDRV